jgi:Putative Flp pilus-assembly TadE/G-like
MKAKTISRGRRSEQGQTIILVAIALVSLLAMAALAIDVVTLYAARSETQRAADAAAMAAAKAIADSGYTTLPTNDTHYTDGSAKALAQAMSNAAIDAMHSAALPMNLVAGNVPAAVPAHPLVDFSRQGNPHVTVTMQVTTLPTFFARIWGNSTATVTASATAEAYNPANVPSFTPIAPKGVKPWFVANRDPSTSLLAPFITTSTGAIEPGVIGETFNLTADCSASPVNSCTLIDPVPTAHNGANNNVDYVPAAVQNPSNSNNVCPSVSSCTENPSYPSYQYSIQCHDVNPYPCGGSTNNATWDPTVNPGSLGGPSALGAECLIHASSSGQAGQDQLENLGPWPNAPYQFLAQSGLQSGYTVTTSSSVVTIPIFDQTTFNATPNGVTVVGFMQAFINQVQTGAPATPGDINVTVLNIAGCSSTPNPPPPVIGSGTSPIPVRLITPP